MATRSTKATSTYCGVFLLVFAFCCFFSFSSHVGLTTPQAPSYDCYCEKYLVTIQSRRSSFACTCPETLHIFRNCFRTGNESKLNCSRLLPEQSLWNLPINHATRLVDFPTAEVCYSYLCFPRRLKSCKAKHKRLLALIGYIPLTFKVYIGALFICSSELFPFMVVLALSFNGDGADLPQVEHGISQVRRNHENELVFKISRICSHFV